MRFKKLIEKQQIVQELPKMRELVKIKGTHPPLIGGMMANSSLFFRIVDSVAYSSFKARTTEFLISSNFGNLLKRSIKQSLVVLPEGIFINVSVNPVRSLALAKNRTLTSIRRSFFSSSDVSDLRLFTTPEASPLIIKHQK